MPATPLSTVMRALADDGHPRADELRQRADEFDAKVGGETRSMLGAWARAKKLWAECTGNDVLTSALPPHSNRERG